MKSIQKLLVFVFVLITGFTVVTASVSAASDNAKKQSAVCKVSTRRATNTLRFYDRQETKIVAIFTRRIARLETLSAKFAGAGKDVASLNEDIATVKTMVEGLKADIDAVQTKAEAVKNLACDDANRQQAVDDMKAAELKVRQTRIAINKFIGTEIGADLDALDGDE